MRQLSMTKQAIRCRDAARKKAAHQGRIIKAYGRFNSDDRAAYKRMARICAKPGFKAAKHDAHIKLYKLWSKEHQVKKISNKNGKHQSHVSLWKSLFGALHYKTKYNQNVDFQLKERIRRQVNKAKKRDGIGEVLRGSVRNNHKSRTVEHALGYSIADFIKHIEKQFHDGMTWDKFMAGVIHIDHIVPQAAFDLTNDEEWKTCWSLPNLRPLWARDNLTKRDKRVSLL